MTAPIIPAVAIAGMVRMSTCDWPGHLVATLFLQGCPWRCAYCHNPDILDPRTPGRVSWEEVVELLRRRAGLLDGVVFSGGEPTRQHALVDAAHQVRDLGFKAALHTAGAHPRGLERVLPLTTWVGLDIKALPETYSALTGVPSSAAMAWESLELVVGSGVDHEVRVTVDGRFHDDEHLHELTDRLRAAGAARIVLQPVRSLGARTPTVACPPLDADHWSERGVVVRRS